MMKEIWRRGVLPVSMALTFATCVSCSSSGNSSASKEEEESAATYPVERTLKLSDGEELEAELLGRSKSHVVLKNLADGEQTELALDDLSLKDRIAIEKMPIHEVPAELVPLDPLLEQFIALRQQELDTHSARLEALKTQRKNLTVHSRTAKRDYYKELDKLEWIVQELKQEIREATAGTVRESRNETEDAEKS